jgi:hypothetical protein
MAGAFSHAWASFLISVSELSCKMPEFKLRSLAKCFVIGFRTPLTTVLKTTDCFSSRPLEACQFAQEKREDVFPEQSPPGPPLSVLAQLTNLRISSFPQAGQCCWVSASPANISFSKQWPHLSHWYS